MFAPTLAKRGEIARQNAVVGHNPTAVRPHQAPGRAAGNQAALRLLAQRAGLQAKLEVGRVDDPLEHEADRVADQVMRMPDPAVSVTAAPLRVSRKCADCEAEEKLQRKPSGLHDVRDAAPDLVHSALRSPGQMLDPAMRAWFQPRLGYDFSGVRVHTDAQAAASAGAIQARAYTSGRDVVFARGQFAPATTEGRRLLAHELVHVAQQSGARQQGPARGRDNRPAVGRSPRPGSIARQPAHAALDPTSSVTTVDATGKVQPDKAAGEGVWRIPVSGLRKDHKGSAVVLIPNTAIPPASDKGVAVDVLLHFHGYGAGYRQLQAGEQDYAGVLKPGELRDVDLYEMEQQLLAHVKTSKRLVVAVLPQGSERSGFGDLASDSDAYLADVFSQLVPAHLPKGTVPGHVTVSGHSGGGVAAMAAANQRTKAGKRTDVLLFDAINFACAERVPLLKDGVPVVVDGKPKTVCKDPTNCASNEYATVKAWVLERIQADVAGLPSKPDDQKAKLESDGTRFRGYTSEPLDTKNSCSYGFWYNKLADDKEKAIGKLAVSDDIKAIFRKNYDVKHVPGPHERVLAHGSLEAALAT